MVGRHISGKTVLPSYWRITLLFFGIWARSLALENGLARTPPMGWLSWERFRCNTDCVNDPDNCISERLIQQMADHMAFGGYAFAGYKYVIIDDCWAARTRDKNGKLRGDPERFPSGMKALSQYIHSRGLKFGIYANYGNLTCGGYPGMLGSQLETDANTFAEWNVDYVKVDGCNANVVDYDIGYPKFGHYLNKTGVPMVYSCSWPVYQSYANIQPNFAAIIKTCNLWRIAGDIDDSWSSIEGIIDYYGDNQNYLTQIAGPGHWNDPDMLVIGNFGLSFEQSKSQMAIWAILTGPMLMSVDLRNILPEHKAILKNKDIIAVSQDKYGIQGKRIFKKGGVEIWVRPISPKKNSDYSYAVVFLNRRTDGTPVRFSFKSSQIGLKRCVMLQFKVFSRKLSPLPI